MFENVQSWQLTLGKIILFVVVVEVVVVVVVVHSGFSEHSRDKNYFSISVPKPNKIR